jgi:hypothetical protein
MGQDKNGDKFNGKAMKTIGITFYKSGEDFIKIYFKR